MTDLDHRIEITWRRGAYYLSVPNYQGGTVYTCDQLEALATFSATPSPLA